jgi:molecular chaperone Hsp33
MKNERQVWYDADRKIKVTMVDTSGAAQALACGHLAGPTSAYFLSEALSVAGLLGEELSEEGETLSLQMKCSGPLGGYNVECTRDGFLRGYTEKKVLDDFDGLVKQPISYSDVKRIVGDKCVQVTRSIPGKILSQGVSTSIDSYLVSSLQRKAVVYTSAAVSDEVKVLSSRGLMIECLPDCTDFSPLYIKPKSLDVSPRSVLDELTLSRAERKSSSSLQFGCRCSPERAAATLAAFGEEERRTLPDSLDVTCHMCGRLFSVKVR